VPTRSRFVWRDSVPFWLLVALLTLVFLTGGASRGDVQSLIVLRPVSVLLCGLALWSLKWDDVRANRFVFGMAAAIFLLSLAHLLPLPPMMWKALPGRELLAEVDRVAAVGDVWRPIALIPSAGWNAFFSLFVPLAALMLGVQLAREQLFKLLPVLLGLGLFSGFWGLLQSVGDPQGPLYLYRVTSNGVAVGLFANRNHQALLLAMLFPMLAVYASVGIISEEQKRFRTGLAIASGVVLIPLLLVTGSRAGLVLGAIGLASSYALYRKPVISTPKKRKGDARFDWRIPILGFVILAVSGIAVIMSRAEALKRLAMSDRIEELRIQALETMMGMVWKYAPIGSGAGSFAEAFQIDEPNALLKPTYFNHAHNDWLEVVITYGLPGVALIAIGLFGLFRISLKNLSGGLQNGRDAAFARLGLVLIVFLAISSVVDYPLRVPALVCVFVIAILWLTGAEAKGAGKPVGTSLPDQKGI
jgi:hypothetical protein